MKKEEKVDKKSKPTDKTSGIKIKDDVKINFEPELEEEFSFILEGNFENDFDESSYILEGFLKEIEDLGETLSVSARIKKRNTMRRYRSRIKIARKRSMRRRATAQKINRRARKGAVSAVKTRYARGHSLKNLSYAEKGRLENIAKRRKNLISRLTRRMVRVKRATETKRLSRR